MEPSAARVSMLPQLTNQMRKSALDELAALASAPGDPDLDRINSLFTVLTSAGASDKTIGSQLQHAREVLRARGVRC